MTNTIDLHLHSSLSDGSLPVSEVLALCITNGIQLAAFTDHDVLAIDPAPDWPRNLSIITGVEVTAAWHDQQVHCLGYLYKPGDQRLDRLVSRYRLAILSCMKEITEKAAHYGCQADWAAVEAAIGQDRVPYGRQLVDLLLANTQDGSPLAAARQLTYGQILAEWFDDNGPLYVDAPTPPDLTEVIKWIRDAEGVPILAHPLAQWQRGDLADDIPRLIRAGLGGLEAWSTYHPSPADTEALLALCSQHGLVATAGSDFHGVTVKEWVPHPGAIPATNTPSIDEMMTALVQAKAA